MAAGTGPRFLAGINIATVALSIAIGAVSAASAQDVGTLDPQPLPPLANPSDPNNPAKELFGRKTEPAEMRSEAIGFYAKGCLAGAEQLPINGPHWQVMRLSRNRNWGHPTLIKYIERLSERGARVGWPGLLIGDMAQPRGGPMLTGHASHQVGLDADIWLRPMPDHELSRQEREEMSATMVVADSRKDVDPKVWTPAHFAILKAAAEDPLVERIFVNAAIKKKLCEMAGSDRAWLQKMRPYWEHDYHFHVRIKCPEDSPECKHQDPVPAGDGCGKELDWWFSDAVLHPKPSPQPEKPRPPIKLADLPAACRAVLNAP
ncbi:MAG TPA: penicillin-insensitive murein endopeptidase [Xanthobacteraceae bacterium]|nr:penicillin-insensitive murein endopeptidase [Xanthobacteraceae bacterium]